MGYYQKIEKSSYGGKQYGVSSIKLPYDLATPLLGIYPKELKAGSQNDICTPMLRAALFMIAETQKQLKRPSTNEW